MLMNIVNLIYSFAIIFAGFTFMTLRMCTPTMRVTTAAVMPMLPRMGSVGVSESAEKPYSPAISMVRLLNMMMGAMHTMPAMPRSQRYRRLNIRMMSHRLAPCTLRKATSLRRERQSSAILLHTPIRQTMKLMAVSTCTMCCMFS